MVGVRAGEFFVVDESGEGIVGAGISGLGRRSNVEGSIEGDVG